MTEILSQNEIDTLLGAISDGGGDEIETTMEHQKQVKIYDFKRPDKFSKDQIRTLQMIHEAFARMTTTSLSALLRTIVNVHVASVDQITYEEFIRSIPAPTTLGIINMEPLKGNSILEMDPSITFTIIDRLFGGSGEAIKMNRELTDIELTVIESIIVRIMGNLREAWSNVIDLRPRLGNMETNPQFAQIVPPNDMVVLITLETRVGDVEGMTNFCVPYITLEPIINKLSAQYWYSSIRKGATRENFNLIKNRINHMPIDLTAELGNVEITMRDMVNIKAGDIIRLGNKKLNDPIILKIANKDKFYGRPGLHGNKMAVIIDDTVTPHLDPEDVYSYYENIDLDQE